MEPVTALPIPGAVKLTPEQQAEYGKPSIGKTVVKYVGYGLLVLFVLGMAFWPVFLSIGHK